MRAIAIVNQKGGCGKTITAINLSAFLAMENRRVLLIDMDPQGHATLGLLKEDSSREQKTIYEVLAGERGVHSLADVIVTIRENLDLVPADILLSALPEKLSGTPGREHRLSAALKDIRQNYDYIIVDCPPSVGLLTFNALMACSEAIIPVEPSFFSLHGIGMQTETLDLLTRKAAHNIRARALITLYTGRSEFVKAVAEEIRKHLGDRTFATVIRYSVKLVEAAGHGLPVAEFSRRSAGFADYRALAREITDQESPSLARSAFQEASQATSVAARPASIDAGLAVKASLQASPPRATQGGILFTIEAPEARCVQLAADFNGWVADGNEMQPNGQVWKKVVPLAPGCYHYRYVVDGAWRTDPLNVNVEPTPWGSENSVFFVRSNDRNKTAET